MSSPASEALAAPKTGPNRTPSTPANLLAGSFGGFAQVITGQPLDVIKTRAQTAPQGTFKGPLDILKQTIAKEGVFALYKGTAAPLAGVAAVNSLLFASNNAARRLLNPYGPNDISIAQVAVAGAMAGAAQSIAAGPVEMFKVRMQAQYSNENKKNLRQVVGEMYTKYGWKRGIFRGYWITVAREIPAYAGFYGAYVYTQRSLKKSLGVDELPIWATLTAGATGGIAYWTACYPLDVVKSRIQLAELPPRGFNYIGATFAKIYREEGLAAFARGLTPTYLRAVPAAASTFVAYEFAMGLILKHTDL